MAENFGLPIPQPVRLSTAALTDLRTQLIRNREEALSSRSAWPGHHAERYRRFLADPALRPPGPWPDAARLFISVTRYTLEKLHSDLWQTLFNLPQNIRLVPFGEEDVAKAQVATRFLHWTLRRVIDFQSVSSDLLFDALLDSAGIAKVVAYSPPWSLPATAERFFERIVRIDALDQGTLLIPPDATGLQYPEARYIGQEFHFRADDLIRLRRQGYDIPSHDHFRHAESDQTPTERQRVELERDGHSLYPYHPDTYLCVESYERFPLTAHGPETDLIISWFPSAQAQDGTHSAQGHIARIRRLTDVYPQDDRPRRPFFPVTIWPQPRQWRGMNVPDRIESMQDLVNRLHEQVVNYGEVSMLPYVFANTFLTGDLPDLRQVRPGSVVPIDDVNGVEFAPSRSLNRHFMEQIQLALGNVEKDTSVTDFSLGRQSDRPNAPRTATATLSLLQEGRKTFSMLSKHAANQFAHLLTFYQRLWQEVMPNRFRAPTLPISQMENPESQDILQRLFGGHTETRTIAETLTREQLSGLFDAEVEINPEAPYERQTLTYLAQLILPSTANYARGQRELLRRVWEGFDQKGFEQIWPRELADTQTNVQLLTLQIQTEQLRMQLQQMQAAQMQVQAQMQAAQSGLPMMPAGAEQPGQPGQPQLAGQAAEGANPTDQIVQQLLQTVGPAARNGSQMQAPPQSPNVSAGGGG